jgi:fructose 1,6-bisphosphate aldolase/phosphatase
MEKRKKEMKKVYIVLSLLLLMSGVVSVAKEQKITLSAIKADVGSIGGHTKPTEKMIKIAKDSIDDAIKDGLLIDGMACHTGDDIALLMSHKKGKDSNEIHQFAWNTFIKATESAKKRGCYGAGQDLLADAPSGNIRGAGPGVAEIEFVFPGKDYRPAESFMIFMADKCGPGAYNLPFYLAFADPMYCAGLMLPKLTGPQLKNGFTFEIVDMGRTDGEHIISLNAPEDAYGISMLLRDNERFGIKAIYSHKYGEQSVSASATRLHNIAGKYVGKDDPIAIVRNQGIFPAPEEIVSPFVKAHYIGGNTRGSHNMPLMPVAINTPVASVYCIPIVSCLGFSMSADGKFVQDCVDFFADVSWDVVRQRAQKKAIEMRSQGWSGPAMLPYGELEYSGFKDALEDLESRFELYEKNYVSAV